MRLNFQILSVWASLVSVAPALDLTPIRGFRESDGIRIPVIYFTDAKRKVSYQPPSDWRVAAGGASMQMFPPAYTQAVMQFAVSERKGETEAAAETQDVWERSLRERLPAGAVDIEKVEDCAGRFTINQSASRDVTFAYTITGHRFQATVAVVDISDAQRLTVVVSARQADFKAFSGEAFGSLFSWHAMAE